MGASVFCALEPMFKLVALPHAYILLRGNVANLHDILAITVHDQGAAPWKKNNLKTYYLKRICIHR